MIEGLGWFGSITGMAGAFLLALNNAGSRYGFVCYLASNACLIAYAWAKEAYPFILLYLMLSAISAVGVLCWFRPAWRVKRFDRIRFDVGSYARYAQAARERPWRAGMQWKR